MTLNHKANTLVLFCKTKQKIQLLNPKSILGQLDNANECDATQSQGQPCRVYNINQATQTLLQKFYSDTFNVDNDYALITTKFAESLIHELTHFCLIYPLPSPHLSRSLTLNLRKFNLQHGQLSPQELLNLLQLMCEFQDDYS